MVVASPQRISVPIRVGSLRLTAQEVGIGPVRDVSQAWFWTPAWQAGEDEASRELREHRGRTFDSAEDFLASLDD